MKVNCLAKKAFDFNWSPTHFQLSLSEVADMSYAVLLTLSRQNAYLLFGPITMIWMTVKCFAITNLTSTVSPLTFSYRHRRQQQSHRDLCARHSQRRPSQHPGSLLRHPGHHRSPLPPVPHPLVRHSQQPPQRLRPEHPDLHL